MDEIYKYLVMVNIPFKNNYIVTPIMHIKWKALQININGFVYWNTSH